MIVRSWKAQATREGAAAYMFYFTEILTPQLDRLEGHRGGLVLERADGDGVALTVITFWASMEAVQRFAGDAPDRAVVEPEAGALLRGWDERVTHDEVALDTLVRAAVPRPDRQTLERPIGTWLKQADDAITTTFNGILGTRGLTRFHWQLLNVLVRRGTATRANILEVMHLFVDEAGVEGLLADLRARGWVVEHGADIALSQVGGSEHAVLAREVGTIRRRILDGIGEDGYVTLVALLQRLVTSLAAPG